MKTSNYRGLQVLTIGDIELLEQVHQRLNAEGIIHGWDFAEFMDVVLAENSWSDVSIDQIAMERDDDIDMFVRPPDMIIRDQFDDRKLQELLDQNQMTEWDHE